MPTKKPQSVAKLLSGGPMPRLLDHTRLLARLDQALRRALPTPLGEHCKVLNFKDQILTIGTDGPAWATRLRYQAPALIKHFSARQSVTVRTIRVHITPAQVSRPEPPKRRSHLSAANARLLEQTAEALGDERLRAALLKVASRGEKPKER